MKNVNEVLLVVDVQNDFMPGGALAVAHGDEVVPVINCLARGFSHVVLTQDWHPASHISFAANHAGRQPFEMLALPYGEQVLWPTHCVQNTPGAALHADLDIPHARAVIRKGHHAVVDSYSAFLEADRETRTGLDGWLNSRGITEVVICGLATDFCVGWTACDGRHFGLTVRVVEEASRAIDLDGSMARAHRNMDIAGANFVTISELLG
jgi:nicotinamidase/pyrazinamidase